MPSIKIQPKQSQHHQSKQQERFNAKIQKKKRRKNRIERDAERKEAILRAISSGIEFWLSSHFCRFCVFAIRGSFLLFFFVFVFSSLFNFFKKETRKISLESFVRPNVMTWQIVVQPAVDTTHARGEIRPSNFLHLQ